MRCLNLTGAFLLLALFGESFAMFDGDEAPFDGFAWFSNQCSLPLKDFYFFRVDERSNYATEVVKFGESDPKDFEEKDFEKYDELCNKFYKPSSKDDNYCERYDLFEFQKGVRAILEIKELHCEVVNGKYDTRRLNSLTGAIKKSSKHGCMKFSYWALRFKKGDYSDMQEALKFAENLALAAIREKRDKSSNKVY